jgi:hypothetical protein
MRQRVRCEGGFATYTLRVEADGRVLGESVVRGAGLRHDRPLYLLRDYPIAGGTHRVRVSFVRREHTERDTAVVDTASQSSDAGVPAGRADREKIERSRRQRAAIPPRLVLDTSLTFAPAHVVMITFNPDRRTLEIIEAASRAR